MTPLLIVVAIALAIPLALFGSAIRLDRPARAVEARQAGHNSRFVMVDGLRMHCTDTGGGPGTGPAIVLIHGINANFRSFDGWVAEFSSAHRVIAVDLPGHGLTGPDPRHRYTWTQMAELVYGLTRELGLDRFVLCGNSLGGAVSQALTLAHPESVRALVLIDAIGGPMRGPMPPALKALSRPVLGPIFATMTPREVVKRVLASTYGDPGRLSEAEVDAAYDLTLRAGNRAAAREVLKRGAGQGLSNRVHEIAVPTLILWGDRDSWVSPDLADWFVAQIKGASLVRFPDLGHLPMAEDPKATAAALRDFIATLP